MYHKVDLTAQTMWWISVNAFYRQLMDLADRTFVLLDDYDPANPDHVCITFDGVYRNVLRYAAPEMHRRGIPFELFVTSGLVGGDNAFDAPEPPAPFADRDDLRALVALGGRLQWHTRTHADLRGLPADALASEMDVPDWMRALDPAGFRWVAYPYGRWDDAALAAARARFPGGIACDTGDFKDRMLWPRVTALEKSDFRRKRISVIVPCYNYGKFLVEAVDSLLTQTRRPDEILIADDGSTDETPEICADLAEADPELIRIQRNPTNLGIVGNFNLAVRSTTGHYVCLLGADNRFCSDYLERTSALLDRDPALAIAYTDFAFFGPRAPVYYREFPVARRGQVRGSYYEIRFPEFADVPQAEFEANNFIHGSSMYRRAAFDQVGGYRDRQEAYEDHQLFLRMVKAGWKAKRVPRPLLEYRQHSQNQASAALNSELQIAFYRRLAQERSNSAAYVIQLFIDAGGGFTEEGSLRQTLTARNQQSIVFDLAGRGPILQLRLDPINDRAQLAVLRLALHFANGRALVIEEFASNAAARDGATLTFASDDPQMWFPLPEDSRHPDRLEVVIDYQSAGRATLAAERRHRAQFEAQESRIARARAEGEALAARGAELAEQLAAAQRELAARGADIADREAAIAARDAVILARDGELSVLRGEIARLGDRLATTASRVAELMVADQAHQAAARDHQALLAQARDQLTALAADGARLQGELAAGHARESQAATELAELRGRIERLQTALADREAVIAALYGSRSWRLTAGLRWVGRALRGARGPRD